ncbi:MAG: 50S ribosomal protein L35 [Patescibacteria group bacterium]
MKIKTKKIISKRFKRTKNNKLLHKIKGVNHLISKRTSKRRNRDRQDQLLSKTATSKILKFVK